MTHPPTIALSGAGPCTGNLGVDALRVSVLDAMRQRASELQWVVLGHRSERRHVDGELAWAHAYPVVKANVGLGLYHRSHLFWLYAGARVGVSVHPDAALLRRCRCMLDVSGGDSFADLYGWKVFAAQVIRKRIALDSGLALMLLPQTYGPFQRALSRNVAASIVRRACMCWARDKRSFEILCDLLGDAFDPARHRCGVDVAFALRPIQPANNPQVDCADGPFVGLNVSGLIHNDPEKARSRYRLCADYGVAMRGLAERLIDTGARVMLVPHVVTPRGHYESDTAAAESLIAALSPIRRERATIAPEFSDPRHAKWLISRCEWFCGTRMHAAIAALSSGVPTAAIAYSDKTLGVFETCGQGNEVVDPRRYTTGEVVERLWDSYQRREVVRRSLADRLPGVLAKASQQMDEIAAACERFAQDRSVRQPAIGGSAAS